MTSDERRTITKINRGRGSLLISALCLIILTAVAVAGIISARHASLQSQNTPPKASVANERIPLTSVEVNARMAKMGIPFIPNQGQTDENVKFYANTLGGTAFITKKGEIVYSLQKVEYENDRLSYQELIKDFNRSATHTLTETEKNNLKKISTELKAPQIKSIKTVALKEELVDARVKDVKGEDAAVAKVNYFKGNDKSKWQRNIPTYNVVSLGEVYKGVEVKLKAHGSNVEKFFYVKPGAKPENIRLKLSGGKLNVNKDGELEVSSELGVVKFSKPIAYQEEEGKKEYVQVAYAVNGDEYGFKVGEYDRGKELVIDPILAATYIGGDSPDFGDHANAIAVDHNENVFVVGLVGGTNFPCIGMSPSPANCAMGITPVSSTGNIFVVKLDSSLSTFLAVTFLDRGNTGFGLFFNMVTLELDSVGNVLVAGATSNSSFPGISETSADSTLDGNDGFLVKLNSSLSSILAATYVGGKSGEDVIRSIDFDSSGNIYVTGITTATAFPCIGDTPANCAPGITPADNAGFSFVAKLDSDLTTILGATLIFGDTFEEATFANSIAVNSVGVFISGVTLDKNLPCGADPLPSCAPGVTPAISTSPGDVSTFVIKLNLSLDTVLAATYIASDDFMNVLLSNGANFGVTQSLVALGNDGRVYVAGATFSDEFPCISTLIPICEPEITPADAFGDIFVVKFDEDLSSILAATRIGGNGLEVYPGSIIIDDAGSVYVGGSTSSSDFPCIGASPANCAPGITPADNTFVNGESFIVKLNPSLSLFLYATYLGGSSFDAGLNLQTTYLGLHNTNLYVAGTTESTDFPGISPQSADSTFGPSGFPAFGSSEAFVAKIDITGIPEDTDDDGIADSEDNCPEVVNPEQIDSDEDGIGDECDDCPNDSDNDIDSDGICASEDNCPDVSNPNQEDTDGDGTGDVCDESPFGVCGGKPITRGCSINLVQNRPCIGTNANDLIIGTNRDDVIAGLGGLDIINGLGGNDTICGGDGPDSLSGGFGNDTLIGEQGFDSCVGGLGFDTVDSSCEVKLP